MDSSTSVASDWLELQDETYDGEHPAITAPPPPPPPIDKKGDPKKDEVTPPQTASELYYASVRRAKEERDAAAVVAKARRVTALVDVKRVIDGWVAEMYEKHITTACFLHPPSSHYTNAEFMAAAWPALAAHGDKNVRLEIRTWYFCAYRYEVKFVPRCFMWAWLPSWMTK